MTGYESIHFVYLRFWLTDTEKCTEKFREHRAGSVAFLPGVFAVLGWWNIIWDMKFPMVSAAWSCIRRVAWVQVRRGNTASNISPCIYSLE